MDSTRWLRIIIIGLVLAALAITYYLLTGAFSLSKNRSQTSTSTTEQTIPAPSVIPAPSAVPTATPQSAFDRAAVRNQAQVQNLPNTGFPIGLSGVLLLSVMVAGLGLRKFPN